MYTLMKTGQLIRKYRIFCLIFFGLLGGIISYTCYSCDGLNEFMYSLKMENRTKDSLFILLGSLVPMFLLWYYRNHDRQEQINIGNKQIEKSNEQIEKSNEQIEKSNEQMEMSMLIHILPALSDKNNSHNVANALKLAMLLRKTTKDENIKNQINRATQNTFLEKAYLYGTHLQGAKLQYANLQNANLQDALLENVRMFEADLRGADLRGAKLRVAYMEKAKYNSKTIFPDDFKPENYFMTYVE